MRNPQGEPAVVVPFDDAVKRLRANGPIHTFRQGGGLMLVGADWPREELLAAMMAAPAIEETGKLASSMGHGLAIMDGHGWLFIETLPEPH